MPEHVVESLAVQAQMTEAVPEQRGLFGVLVRHFLDRFFNNEMAASKDDVKARLVQVACAAGLPGLIFALYLFPPYHDIRGPRPYWWQVSDHYFYVMYSLAAMGVITVFEWDFFFPDLLDTLVLSSLPIFERKLFAARISAAVIFLAAFLFDSNVLAFLVLPEALDPPRLLRFLAAHLVAVTASGVFAAAFFLALQGLLLGIAGERLFAKVSLFLQGISVTALLTLLFLCPALSVNLPALMHSQSKAVLCFPPFWFLGIYQHLLEGSSAPPIFIRLAHIGFSATLWTVTLAILAYPFAYWRRTRQLVEGPGARKRQSWVAGPLQPLLHGVVFRSPRRRAICDFIGKTLLRVRRYRIYLVMYGGLGAALVLASAVRLNIAHGQIRFGFSPDGVPAATAIVAFWTVAGLRTAFLSPADQRGNWIFRAILGKPGLEQLTAARLWVLLWALILTLGIVAAAHSPGVAGLRGWRATAAQLLAAVGLCVLLTDVLFLKVKTVPFTGLQTSSTRNLAIVMIQYIGFFPPLIVIAVSTQPWLAASTGHLLGTFLMLVAAHLLLQRIYRRTITENLELIDLEEGEDEFPQKLGLRY